MVDCGGMLEDATAATEELEGTKEPGHWGWPSTYSVQMGATGGTLEDVTAATEELEGITVPGH